VDVEESKQCWDCGGSWLDWLDPTRHGLVVFAQSVQTQFPAIFSSFGIGMVLSSLLTVYTLSFPAFFPVSA
jgi:hypothetical protein